MELSAPGFDRVGFVAVEHVPHRQAQRMQFVLDAQELEGILAIPVHGARLQVLQSGNLVERVEREHRDRGERDRKPHEQTTGRRRNPGIHRLPSE